MRIKGKEIHTKKCFDETGKMTFDNTIESEIELKVLCDMCGVKQGWRDWSSSYYQIDETKVSIKIEHGIGTSYPEGGSCTTQEWDICPSCFETKLIPFLKSQKCVPVEKTIDY